MWACAAVMLCLLASPPAAADVASSLSGEINAVASYSELDEWTAKAPGSQRNSVGFEYFGKLSNDFGDFLTVDVQLRLSHDPDESDHEGLGVELHNAWAEHRLGLGRNVRIGHFSPAFGLEPVVDTHGTILQTLAMQDIGFKKDWGVGYRGVLGPFDLSFAGQLGSGVGIQMNDGSFLATAQIWTPPGDEFRYGFSLLAGRVLRSTGGRLLPEPEFASEAVTKTRAGAAAEYTVGSFEFEGELSVGRDKDRSVAGGLVQTGYTPPSLQDLTLELQVRAWSGDTDESEALASSITAGGSYRVTRGWTLRAYLAHDIERPGDTEDTRAVFQAYFFGG